MNKTQRKRYISSLEGVTLSEEEWAIEVYGSRTIETQSMNNEYFVFKTILTGLELHLTGESLRRFVMSSTSCTLTEFDTVYQQIQEAWHKK